MFYLNNIIISIFLGIIEGITEFLPVSSTGHIIIFLHLFKIENNKIKMFETFIQIGTTLSILFFFIKKSSYY
jgi:undecaprenyl-diphosphatase